jgi:glycosyltransferase involved in cell wall biosynthesis
MRVLIDDALAGRGKKSGIGYFAVNLARHLEKFVSCDITEFNLIHMIPRYFKKWAYLGVSNIPSLFSGYDVIHHVSEYVPLIKGKSKHILTVHDLSSLHYPKTISIAWRHYNQHAFKKSVHRADGIITVSESVRNELLSTFPALVNSQVAVCPAGVRTELLRAKPMESDLDGLRVQPFSFFLYVGVLHRRKNLGFLLRSFIAAKSKALVGEKTELVLVGKPALGYTELRPFLREDTGIREMGYLNDRQIAALYRYCKAFVFPSLYEGFGAPLVEAMSQGAPIVISRIAASQELNKRHGGHMLSFELGDDRRLLEILQPPGNYWKELRESLSYGDLSRYSYDNVALEHIRIYRSVCENSFSPMGYASERMESTSVGLGK